MDKPQVLYQILQRKIVAHACAGEESTEFTPTVKTFLTSAPNSQGFTEFHYDRPYIFHGDLHGELTADTMATLIGDGDHVTVAECGMEHACQGHPSPSTITGIFHRPVLQYQFCTGCGGFRPDQPSPKNCQANLIGRRCKIRGCNHAVIDRLDLRQLNAENLFDDLCILPARLASADDIIPHCINCGTTTPRSLDNEFSQNCAVCSTTHSVFTERIFSMQASAYTCGIKPTLLQTTTGLKASGLPNPDHRGSDQVQQARKLSMLPHLCTNAGPPCPRRLVCTGLLQVRRSHWRS